MWREVSVELHFHMIQKEGACSFKEVSMRTEEVDGWSDFPGEAQEASPITSDPLPHSQK